jgi:hypothetical protein
MIVASMPMPRGGGAWVGGVECVRCVRECECERDVCVEVRREERMR